MNADGTMLVFPEFFALMSSVKPGMGYLLIVRLTATTIKGREIYPGSKQVSKQNVLLINAHQ